MQEFDVVSNCACSNQRIYCLIWPESQWRAGCLPSCRVCKTGGSICSGKRATAHWCRSNFRAPMSGRRAGGRACCSWQGCAAWKFRLKRRPTECRFFTTSLENKVLGREYKRGHQEGLQEGRRGGRRVAVRQFIEKRFGALPEWASQRLSQASEQELSDFSDHLFDAQSLEELLR